MLSSESSVLPKPIELSDSLDTAIGFNTEVGRDTVVNSSSSGAQALSDPTLKSSDSSQSAHAQNVVRSAPLPPPWPGPPPAEECPGPPRPAATVTQMLAPGNPTSAPATAASTQHPAPAATGLPVQPDNAQLLQLLQQQQQQQQQQHQQQQQQQNQMMQQMMHMMERMHQPAPPARGPNPPLPTSTTRQPSAAAQKPWAAPPPPLPSMATGKCDL